MPHAEIFYSPELDIDTKALLVAIEAVILNHDDGTGDCKGRAYRADIAHHTHMKVVISLLPKPHRGAKFVADLQAGIYQTIADVLPRPCWLSVDITFSGSGYRTELLT